jgi:hypothetical protein
MQTRTVGTLNSWIAAKISSAAELWSCEVPHQKRAARIACGWMALGLTGRRLGQRRIVKIVGIGQAGVHREQKFQELADIGNQIGL